MMLRSMVSSHDDLALETLTSKGLLRRAQRDLESGQGRVEGINEGNATILVGQETVVIDENGPQISQCSCKAHGVCRHILVAMMLLRDHLPAVSEPDNDSEKSTALTEICGLTIEEIIKFAGTDWSKALTIFSDDLQTSILEKGSNISIRMPELNSTVTFIVGNGLKAAAFKGPKTRKRLISTLAALVVRQKQGLAKPVASLIESAGPGINPDFIENAQRTIEQAVSATLVSRSPLGKDLFLDLAISSRCETLPRLSAELRALANQSQFASDRSADFESPTFVLQASRSYTLLEVLRSNSVDQLLTGSIKREYKTAPEMEVWPLAVSRWRSRTGARGLSAYLLKPESCQWLTTIEGRKAGTDLSYDVSNAYQMPVWGSGTLSGVIGRRIHLSRPLVTDDGALSSKPQDNNCVSDKPITLENILESDAAHSDWGSLRKDIQTRMGQGVRRRQVPIPALIIPSKFGRVGFDDMNQFYTFEVYDKLGASLVLSIPAEDDETAASLWRMGKDIRAIVVESSLGRHGLEIRPVSILLPKGSDFSVHNIDFDQWPIERGIRKMISNFRESVSKQLLISQFEKDSPVHQTIADTVDELVRLINSSTTKNTASLIRRLESIGLVTLADSLDNASKSLELRSILKAGFIASEIETMIMLD